MSIDWIPTEAVRAIPAKERGNRGIFPSTKVPGGLVEYESCLERDFFLVCHHAPDVIRFQHQPISISYKDKNQKDRIYTPDVFVEFTGGIKGLFEIKYEEEVLEKGKKYEERWSAAQEWGKKRNIVFSVITERNIRTPRWINIWFTLGSSKCRSIDSYMSKLIQIIPDKGERYDEICYLFAETQGLEINKSTQILCYAIYHGLLFLDSFSTKQITNNTIIRKKKEKRVSSFKPLWNDLGINSFSNHNEQDEPKKKEVIFGKNNILNSISFRIPLKYEEIVQNKIKIVNLWLSRPKQKRTNEWRIEFCKEWKISERTIYYWVEAYRKNGIGGLIPNHNNSGRQSKFDTLTIELMEKSRQYFLNPLISQKRAYIKLDELCKEHMISIPKFEAFKSFIYNNTTAREFAKKRGKKYQKANFTPSLVSFQGAFAPMQIVQMDNTSFDVFPVDSEYREELSTPYMTAAMDCYSRMITGFCVSYFASSSRTVLNVLVQTILPKKAYINAYGTQQGWPIQGFPVVLLVDNGMDYRSQVLKDFCIKYDIIIEYAPIRTPRYKAFIEQWFNILHKALINEDVSGSRPLLKQRLENPELKPELNAVLTLQEIEEWLHQWVLDEYHFTNPYDDHAPAPHLRWREYQDGHSNILLPLPREPPVEPQEIDLLYLSTFEQIDRILSYEGVVWHHLKYNNKALVKIYNQVGKQIVEVLLNPRDIRCIWVVNPITSIPIKVDLGSGWAQAITKLHGEKPIHVSAWKMDLKLLKTRLKSKISPYLYQKEMSKIKRQELIRTAKKTTKTTRKEKEKEKETRRNSLTDKIRSTPEEDDNVEIIYIPPKEENPFYGMQIDLKTNKISRRKKKNGTT